MKGLGHRWLRSENLCAAVDLPVPSSSRTKTDVGGNVGVNPGYTSQIVLRGLLGTKIDGHPLRLIRVIKSLKILLNPVADRVFVCEELLVSGCIRLENSHAAGGSRVIAKRLHKCSLY